MKILQVSSAYYPYPSGVTEAVHNLAEALLNLGHSVSILTTTFSLDFKDEVKTDIPVARFGRAILIPGNKSYATFPFGFKIPFQVRNFLNNDPFDVIHMHGIFPPEIGFWALHYSRSVNVATFNTYSEKTLPVPVGLIEGIFKKYLKKLHGKIALSNACKSGMAKYIPGEYRIIPHGVDTRAFSPDIRPFEEIVSYRCPILLFLGRLDKRKGLEILLHAMPAIVKRLDSVKLVIVGTGPELPRYRKMVKELGIESTVVFQGFVSKQDLPRYYASGDIFISPALGGEAQGIVLLEAMASGKPVIASDIAGYNETIKDGETGLLFPVGDPHTLAEKIIMVTKNTNLRDELAKNGRTASLAYSWKAVAKKVESYYFELLSRTRK